MKRIWKFFRSKITAFSIWLAMKLIAMNKLSIMYGVRLEARHDGYRIYSRYGNRVWVGNSIFEVIDPTTQAQVEHLIASMEKDC